MSVSRSAAPIGHVDVRANVPPSPGDLARQHPRGNPAAEVVQRVIPRPPLVKGEHRSKIVAEAEQAATMKAIVATGSK